MVVGKEEEDRTEPERSLIIHGDMDDMDIIGGSSIQRVSADNFDGDNMNKMRLELIARGPDSLSGSDLVGKVIEIEYWYAHSIEVEDDGGQLVQCARVCLIGPDGAAVKFASQGVYDVLRMIVKYYGRKRFNPPIRCLVKEVKTRKARKMLTLVPELSKK
jgi:hypothetical protein